MTLRHKSSSKWAKRIKERGVDVQDDGTRAAIAEQQHLHAQLTKKMNSMKDSDTSSADASNDDDDMDDNSDDEGRVSQKAKETTLKLLEEDDEVPITGLLSLAFMKRASKKKSEAAAEETKLAVEQYESWSTQLGVSGGVKNLKLDRPSGRMVFSGKEAPESSKKTKSGDYDRSDNYYGDSDSEKDMEHRSNDSVKDVNTFPIFLHDDCANHKNCNGSAKDPAPKRTTHEVSILGLCSRRKMKNDNDKKSSGVVLDQNAQQEPVNDLNENEDSDADSEGPLVLDYELAPNEEFIRRTDFASDDVEDEFQTYSGGASQKCDGVGGGGGGPKFGRRNIKNRDGTIGIKKRKKRGY